MFNLLQACLADDTSSTPQDSTPASTNQNSPSQSPDLDLDLGDISGTKCRAPFSQSTGLQRTAPTAGSDGA